MIEPDVFSVEPWAVAEPSLRLDLLGQTESIFAGSVAPDAVTTALSFNILRTRSRARIGS